MREILFKAKRVDGKGWVEGFLAEPNVISQLEKDESVGHEEFFDYEIIPETVCQFWREVSGIRFFEGDKFYITNRFLYCALQNDLVTQWSVLMRILELFYLILI